MLGVKLLVFPCLLLNDTLNSIMVLDAGVPIVQKKIALSTHVFELLLLSVLRYANLPKRDVVP